MTTHESCALRGDRYVECGRTEILNNCLDPEWSKSIVVDYFFEEVQKIKFEVYDVDSPSSNLAEHDFIGSADSTLAEIVGAPSCKRTYSLRGKNYGRNHGELTVIVEEPDSTSKEAVVFAVRGVGLDKKRFLGKSDPYLQVYRCNDDGSLQLVHRTEIISRTSRPEWKPFEVSMQQLCGTNESRKIRFDCYHYGNAIAEGRNLIGTCEVELDKLIGSNDLEFSLINEKKRRKKGASYLNSGRIVFMSVTSHRNYSFLEFITGGTRLDFTMAVDMTASNGCVTDPKSLHFLGGSQPNEYHIAIRSVADICQYYNNTKAFDAFGFGAKIPPHNFVNHCFPLNIGDVSPKVFGVGGLLEAYQRAITSCVLYGPTNFAPIISEASKKAASYPRDGSRYQILLIITDGCICDFDTTLTNIISASLLPMSIIIVGVGGENFGNMDALDSDDKLLSFHGRTALRDIVQFVPLRQFLSSKGMACSSLEGNVASAHLAKEVLAEIPDQLTQFMKMNNIHPRPTSDPFPSGPPPPQDCKPPGAVGTMGMPSALGWNVPQSQPTGFSVGFAGQTPYPTSLPPACGSQAPGGYGPNPNASFQYPPSAPPAYSTATPAFGFASNPVHTGAWGGGMKPSAPPP